MKTALKLCGVFIVLLLVLTACTFNQISVRWTVDTTTVSGLPAAQTVIVDYTVWNDGKYDLTGVKLEVGIYSNTQLDYISVYTPEFTLDQGVTKVGTISFYAGADVVAPPAEILGVKMDKPKD